MRLLELIKAEVARQDRVTQDGDPDPLVVQEPLSDQQIRDFESTLPCVILDEVKELLLFCRGFTGGATDFVDFTGESCMYEFEEVFPHGLPFAADGCGNFWVVDLTPESTEWGPIYFACHDAPVILYQCRNLEEFLVESFKWSSPPFESLLKDVCEDRLFDVWCKNPGVMSHQECMLSPDDEIRTFAQALDPSFQIIDLRKPQVGFGFSWGRYGAFSEVRRHGYSPIFAYQKRGFLRRLFG